MSIVFYIFIFLIVTAIIFFNVKVLKALFRYSFKVIGSDLHLSRLWLIDGHLVFKIEEIDKIDFIIKFKLPYKAVIITQEKIEVTINDKSYQNLKLITEQYNIKCDTFNDSRLVS